MERIPVAGPAGKDGANGADSTVAGPAGKARTNGADSTVAGPAGKDGTNRPIPQLLDLLERWNKWGGFHSCWTCWYLGQMGWNSTVVLLVKMEQMGGFTVAGPAGKDGTNGAEIPQLLDLRVGAA
jgi:hypothetical protein